MSGKKHIWHGILFVIVGLFMLGSYITMGTPPPPEESRAFGPVAAWLLMGFGVFLIFFGKGFFKPGTLFTEYYHAITLAIGVALMVRTFVIEPFKIPSGSMIPTLLVGDYLFVNKMAYGHRIPFTSQRAFMGDGPERGDVVVFEFPRNPYRDYIKRVVGLPGDKITYKNKRLFINDKPIEYTSKGPYHYRNERGDEVHANRLEEHFENRENTHSVLVQPVDYLMLDGTPEVVPEGHYFVLGDNRDNSNDSRFWGFVPAHRLLGEAVFLFWSWDRQQSAVRWERVGEGIN
ncbi:MAG: signal peptidase I [Magnetococcales bacterium]|nr:signal peptidase I [Magnetococcales bacterium]